MYFWALWGAAAKVTGPADAGAAKEANLPGDAV